MTARKGTVLVVDDNEINRLLLARQLEQEGYAAVAAEHGRQALERLYEQPCDVVLLDLLMPEMDGFQVLAHLKADLNLRHLPVIVVSAVDEMQSVVRCIEMGATDHLTKPVDPVLLRARLNASLATKRMYEQEAEYRRSVTYLTDVAASIEAGRFDPASLDPLAERTDALGRLARVLQRMAREISMREQSLKQQSQSKTALLGKISHELRSPFVAAELSVQLLQRYVEHNMMDELRQQIGQLAIQLADGRRMIDSVISFAALVGKQTELHREDTDIAQLTHEVVAPLRRMVATRKLSLTYEFAQSLPLVCVDREQMGEAIHHLVLNAIKFNREGGSIQIVCHESGSHLVFLVEDTGVGIPEDKLGAIWEPFVQSADDVRRGIEGMGLGLPLVKYVVEAHRGEVIARTKPDEGSIVGFRIPLA